MSTSIHILLCYLNIYVYKYGFNGFAYIRIITELDRVIFCLIAIFVFKYGYACIYKPTLKIFKKWKEFLKVAVPIGSIVFFDYFNF